MLQNALLHEQKGTAACTSACSCMISAQVGLPGKASERSRDVMLGFIFMPSKRSEEGRKQAKLRAKLEKSDLMSRPGLRAGSEGNEHRRRDLTFS